MTEKRTIEITSSIKATIPTGQYENIAPMYSIKEIIECNGDGEVVNTSKIYDEQRALLLSKVNDDYDRIKVDVIQRQNPDIRFYERGGKKYPSVTSIINWEGIDYPILKLQQYAARGTIIHAQIEHFLNTCAWEEDIEKLEGIKEEVLILKTGDLRLIHTDVDFRGFCEKYKADITFDKTSPDAVYNDEFFYAGQPDRHGTYKGELAIYDFKTASDYDNGKVEKYLKQLAAYNYAQDKPCKYMVIVPLTNKIKAGYREPIIETDMEKYFVKFLADRKSFKKVYGV